MLHPCTVILNMVCVANLAALTFYLCLFVVDLLIDYHFICVAFFRLFWCSIFLWRDYFPVSMQHYFLKPRNKLEMLLSAFQCLLCRIYKTFNSVLNFYNAIYIDFDEIARFSKPFLWPTIPILVINSDSHLFQKVQSFRVLDSS